MSKRERILSVTTGIFGVLAVVLTVILILQMPTGKVDIGYGYEVTQEEFDEYYAIAEQTTKDVLVELKIALDAAKELGVTITDEQIQQETDSMNLIYNYEKGSAEYCDLKLHSAISLIETKCTEHFKSKINPTDEEINNTLNSISDKIIVDCEYKNVSTLDGMVAAQSGIAFEDVETKYEILEAGSEKAIYVDKQDGMKVGGTYVQENGDNYAIFKITKIYSTDAEKREGIVYKLKEHEAENEFYTYISDYYEKKMAETSENATETEESKTSTDKSVDTAGNAE